jgi:hypothetical protein
VVGLTSILLSEAAMLGRPVLSVLPRAAEQEWLLDPPQIKMTSVWQRTALIPALRNMIR